jgi:hypothetical protein
VLSLKAQSPNGQVSSNALTYEIKYNDEIDIHQIITNRDCGNFITTPSL